MSHNMGDNRSTWGTTRSISFHEVPLVGANIVDISYKFGLEYYDSWSARERELFFAKLNPLELLVAVNDVEAEQATLQTENHLLTAFLQKNDPKLLIGLRRKPPSSETTNRTQRTSWVSKSSSVKRTQSQASSLARRKPPEYFLNCKAKADIAEMLALEIEKCLMESEIIVEQELKIGNAQVEELRCSCADNYQTEKSYILHFVSTPEEELSTETSPAALVLKFRKFITHWVKTADGMLDNINLYISNLRDRCHNLRRDIIVKSDMSQFATEIEFERMIIFRNELLNVTKDQQMQKEGLKTTAHRTSYTLTTLSKDFDHLRTILHELKEKIIETKRQREKLGKDINAIEASNAKDRVKLKTMIERLDTYHAPSIDEYMRVKVQQSTLNKEEAVLERKIAILTMKLKTTQCKLNMCIRKNGK